MYELEPPQLQAEEDDSKNIDEDGEGRWEDCKQKLHTACF